MRFLVVGCSYRTAAVDLRERLACPEDQLGAELQGLLGLADIDEALLLSTCNRVEVWCVTPRPQHAGGEVVAYLARRAGVSAEEIEPALIQYTDGEALDHVFRVTGSVDAMVVGETQITGQVKKAYAAAAQAGATGPFLNRCLHKAFGVAKRVRNETEITLHPVSVSSVAVDLAGRVFGPLQSAVVVVIGAGEMAELALRHMISDGAQDIRVLNRTAARAEALARQLQARAFPFEALPEQLLKADIVLSSTSSEGLLLTREQLAAVMKQRRQRPLFIVDIAVPRDVERSAGELPNLYLFDVDDLEQVVAENLKARRKEVGHAEQIIQAEVRGFMDWVQEQDAVPVIKQLREHFLKVARAEAERTAQALRLNDQQQRKAMEAMAEAIVKKLLHQPSVELKEHAHHSDGRFLVRSTRHLFGLSAEEGDLAPRPAEEGGLAPAPSNPGGEEGIP